MFRLAQLAAMLHQNWAAVDRWQKIDVEVLRMELLAVNTHTPWVERSPFISEGLANGLLINIWGYLNASTPNELHGNLPPLSFEDNRITRLFAALDLSETSALDSQAMMELYSNYCQHHRCGACRLASCWVQDQAPQSI